MKKPNFFIVGAPKSGTTALSEYLRSHPNIYMSTPKEPHFFADDLPGYKKNFPTISSYLQLFKNVNSKHIAIGEASVYYLFSQVATKNIFKFNPEAKIIVMLRNPVDLVYSLHSQLLYSRNENEKDFYRAWCLQRQRSQGKNIPKSCTDQKILQYLRVGSLGQQVKRLIKDTGFRLDQIQFILFDDFIKDTRKIYKQTLNFLDVPDDGRTTFLPVNENCYHRINFLSVFLVNPSPIFMKTVRTFKKFFRLKSEIGLTNKVLELNTARYKRPPLSTFIRKELGNAFKDDILLLSQMINRDLSNWLI